MGNKEEWLAERKDLFLRNIIRDFAKSYQLFRGLNRQHRKGHGVSYPILEEWVGTEAHKGSLWNLKDNCHRLWRDLEPVDDPQAFLFDWMVGAIFHEAMKLKENVYLLKKYRPSFEKAVATKNGRDHLNTCQQFFQHTHEDIDKGMNRLSGLFRHAIEHLGALIVSHRDNALVLRFFLENRQDLDKLWKDQGGVERLLEMMFPEGLDQAYCTIGESYLEGSWYKEAREAFEIAIMINPSCSQALSGLRILEKRLNEVISMLAKEYEGYGPGDIGDKVVRRQILKAAGDESKPDEAA